MDNKIFGIKANASAKFDDMFEVMLNDDSFIAESKKTFHIDDNGIKCDYRFYLEMTDSRTMDKEDPVCIYATLSIVPTFSSLDKEKREEVKDFCGNDEPDEYDVFFAGMSVDFGTDRRIIKLEDKTKFIEDPRLDTIASVLEQASKFVSRKLYKPTNLVGINGWELLNTFLNHNMHI